MFAMEPVFGLVVVAGEPVVFVAPVVPAPLPADPVVLVPLFAPEDAVVGSGRGSPVTTTVSEFEHWVLLVQVNVYVPGL